MIALYPGAFKPPHRGHFNVVKSLLDGSYNGTIYNKDNYKEKASSLFSINSSQKPKIDKVIILIGGGERNGIDKQEATAIWEVYAKHLGNVEIVDGQKNPMFAAKDYARENPNEEFVAVTGIRGEEDFVDLRRVTTFNNVDNVQGLALASAPGSGVRATDFRKSILAGNLDKITDFFPEELSREEILGILTDLKDKIVAEIIGSNIDGFINEYFIKEEEGTEVAKQPEVKDYITSLVEYMLDQGMKITPLPEIKLRQDEANAASFFGRTAYYDPNNKEIVVYTSGRHPKDIVRSFSHEMVHHMQNLNGTLGNVQTSNTNEDDHLQELEKEAYLTGNITFRNWEDSLK
jgi:phosphopantetheine adenylyltransferase